MKSSENLIAQKEKLSLVEKLKFLTDKDKEYLCGYIDRAIKDYPKQKGA